MSFIALLNMLFLKLLGFIMSIVLLGNVPFSGAATFSPEDAQNMLLQFGVISDVHMESFTFDRFVGFSQTLRDMAGATSKENALVMLGDNTMNGQPTEYIMLYSLLEQYNRAEHTIVAMGNHDMNRTEYTPQEAIDRNSLFLRSYNGTNINVPYYSMQVNGYTFIVLGDELPPAETQATISQTQLDWFAATMQACEPGKPVFIFLHQPLNHAFGTGWGAVGAQSEALRAIAEQYTNVFFFNGHLHTQQAIKIINGVTYVNLPTLLSAAVRGIGFQAEVYADKIVLRARNYITGEWLPENRYEIPLVSKLSPGEGSSDVFKLTDQAFNEAPVFEAPAGEIQ